MGARKKIQNGEETKCIGQFAGCKQVFLSKDKRKFRYCPHCDKIRLQRLAGLPGQQRSTVYYLMPKKRSVYGENQAKRKAIDNGGVFRKGHMEGM